MASTNKTPNLLLNQWVGTDTVRREDFNADNLLIETAIMNRLPLTGGTLTGPLAVIKGDKTERNSIFTASTSGVDGVALEVGNLNSLAMHLQAYENSVGPKDLIINPDGGNVAIGNITPTAKLHVDGKIEANDSITTNDGMINVVPDPIQISTWRKSLRFYGLDGVESLNLGLYGDITQAIYGYLGFGNAGYGSAAQMKFYPDKTMELLGDIKSNINMVSSADIKMHGSGDKIVDFYDAVGGTREGYVGRINSGGGTDFLSFFNGIGGISLKAFDNGNFNFEGGNVGIGVTLPQAKLHTTGTTILGATTEIALASLNNQEVNIYYDEVADRLYFKYKSSTGVQKKGYIACV